MTRRRRRRGALALLLVLLVVAVLAVGADRAAKMVAQNRAAAQLQTRLGTSTRPTVDIQGFPFLTQARRRSFSSVHVVADGLHPPGQQTTVQHADLTLLDVTSSDNSSFRAGRVQGRVTLDYPSVRALTGQALSYAPTGRVQVSAPTTVLGLPVTATVVGRPVVHVADQTFSLSDPQLSVAGVSVPDSTAKQLLATVVKPAPVSGLPYGLKLADVTARPDGLVAGVAGTDVNFSG